MLKKNDFVELDFIARIKETQQVFDTTLQAEAEKAGLIDEKEKEPEKKFKPLRICMGQGMILSGLDKAIEGKELGKWYGAELLAKEAFGLRNPKLIKILSASAFRGKGIEPAAGMVLTLDNMLVRIAAVSGGRVIVDFNSPLAGKVVLYKFRVNKKIEDEKEKLEILTEFFLGKAEKIQVEDKKTVLEFKIKPNEKIVDEFKKKVNEILDMDVEIKEAEEIKEKEKIGEGEKKDKRI